MDSAVIKQWEKRVGMEKTQTPDLARFEENLSTAMDASFDNAQPKL